MIERLTDRDDADALWPRIEDILLHSPTERTFAGDAARAAFLESWTGYYRRVEPDNIFVAIEPPGRLAGYLMGCFDSAARARHDNDATGHPFADRFADYPAHLHINCHPDFRGRGIGAALVAAFVDTCRDAGLGGVHIVTGVGARNAGFYRKCGFVYEVERERQGKELLFMGRRLADGSQSSSFQ